jgi:hypothetical protein
MDPMRALIVVGITLTAVIALNVFLYLAFRDRKTAPKNGPNEIEMARSMWNRAKDPWGNEDEALKELNRITSELKSTLPKDQGPSDGRS